MDSLGESNDIDGPDIRADVPRYRTTDGIGDEPSLPGLLSQTPENEAILRVGGAEGSHAAIAMRNTDPVIAVRRNSKTWIRDSSGFGARHETLRTIKCLGRGIWQK